MVSRARALVLGAALAAACQGRRDGDSPSGPPEPALLDAGSGGVGSGFGSAPLPAPPIDAGPDDARGSGSGSAAAVDDPDPPDPGKQIAELGAIPAWQAVVDRAQLLARRGQQGVIYGRVGAPILVPAPPPPPPSGSGSGSGSAAGSGSGSAAAPPPPAPPGPPTPPPMVPSPYVWLIDDTEGNGALGIRLALGKLTAAAGDRIAVRGAWELDEERRWFWRAAALQPLSPPPASESKDPPSAVPSHVPAVGGFPPNVRPIKLAKDGDAAYFQLVGPFPTTEGDGWLVAERQWDLPIALVLFPGERPSYGGQDLRSPDERWQLKRQQLYWVRLGKLRPQGPGKPPIVRALTAPVAIR